MQVDGQKDLRMVLSKNDCPLSPDDKKLEKVSFHDEINAPQDDPRAFRPSGRADIPIISAIDDSKKRDFKWRLPNLIFYSRQYYRRTQQTYNCCKSS